MVRRFTSRRSLAFSSRTSVVVPSRSRGRSARRLRQVPGGSSTGPVVYGEDRRSRWDSMHVPPAGTDAVISSVRARFCSIALVATAGLTVLAPSTAIASAPTVTATVPVGSFQYGVAVDPATDKVYVAKYTFGHRVGDRRRDQHRHRHRHREYE